MKRENKEANTCALTLLVLLVGQMIFCQIIFSFEKQTVPWMIVIANCLYMTSQMSILLYCWSVSGKIRDQTDGQTLIDAEEELKKDILDINNEFVRLYEDQET